MARRLTALPLNGKPDPVIRRAPDLGRQPMPFRHSDDAPDGHSSETRKRIEAFQGFDLPTLRFGSKMTLTRAVSAVFLPAWRRAMKLKSLFVGLAAGSVLAAPLQAAETVSYTYDALGRITTTTTSGGPASGIATGTGYDPAGNRTTYTVTGASAALQMTPFAGDRQLARLGAGPARGAGPKGPERVPHGGL